MNDEFEQLVRGSMEWFAGGVHVPSGLAGRARQQVRRRRRRTRAAIAAGTAVVSAAALIAVTAGADGFSWPGTGTGQATQAQAAAYIVRRAEKAIGTRGLIMEISSPEQVITTRRPGQDPGRDFVPRSVRWVYHDQSRSEIFAAYLRTHGHQGAADTDTENGPLSKSVAGSPSLHPFTQTTVNYTARTWSRRTQLTGRAFVPPGNACQLVRAMTDPRLAAELLFTSPRYVHSALACGGFSVTGHVRVDGAAAVRLTSSHALLKLPLTMYVSPATYRLIRAVIGGLREDYRWLRPTPASVAMLKVRIPAGFRRVRNASGPPP